MQNLAKTKLFYLITRDVFQVVRCKRHYPLDLHYKATAYCSQLKAIYDYCDLPLMSLCTIMLLCKQWTPCRICRVYLRVTFSVSAPYAFSWSLIEPQTHMDTQIYHTVQQSAIKQEQGISLESRYHIQRIKCMHVFYSLKVETEL